VKNVYEKIEKIYATKQSDEPAWVAELRDELREIKILLQNGVKPARKKRRSKAYFDFVNLLRERLKADTVKEIYPELEYKGKRIGVNFKGFLYDKETTKSLAAFEAFKVYEYFYEKQESMERFIIID